MTVRIWDKGEFERLPERVKYSKEYKHQLHCQAPGCSFVATGRRAALVAKRLQRHREDEHGG